MFANVFEFKAGTTRVNRARRIEQSCIELRFPRIAQELVTRWQRDDIDAFLSSLLLDDRGNRQGFPMDVLEELMFLSNLRWQLQHPHYHRVDEVLVEQFSFSPLSLLDTRFCEPKRSWVF